MKLGQNGIVSFPIRLAVFQARGGACMKHCEYYFTAEIAKTAEKIIKQINI
jgi:hypothetical protein